MMSELGTLETGAAAAAGGGVGDVLLLLLLLGASAASCTAAASALHLQLSCDRLLLLLPLLLPAAASLRCCCAGRLTWAGRPAAAETVVLFFCSALDGCNCCCNCIIGDVLEIGVAALLLGIDHKKSINARPRRQGRLLSLTGQQLR